MNNNILEVVDKIPQIKSIQLYENDNNYIMEISYRPRYGYGYLYRGSVHGENPLDDYEYIVIGDLDAHDNGTILQQTEIRLRFPLAVCDIFINRHKDEETYMFLKSNNYEDNFKNKLVKLEY